MLRMGLPEWAKPREKKEGDRGAPWVDVDTHAAYPAILKELGIEKEEQLDQYWLEVAYQCIKMDVQMSCGFNIQIRMRDPDKRYAQKKYPKGKGAFLATQGREARGHYKRLRGALPSA
jgi:hypothetical protein